MERLLLYAAMWGLTFKFRYRSVSVITTQAKSCGHHWEFKELAVQVENSFLAALKLMQYNLLANSWSACGRCFLSAHKKVQQSIWEKIICHNILARRSFSLSVVWDLCGVFPHKLESAISLGRSVHLGASMGESRRKISNIPKTSCTNSVFFSNLFVRGD